MLFVLSGLLLFSSVIGGKMIGNNNHLSSPEVFATIQIPFIDWKIGPGDLRISHFLGMHGLQIFALIGIYINGSPSLSRKKIFGFYTLIAVYSILVISVFVMAIG